MLEVNDVMTRNPESIRSNEPVQEAINKLFELDVRHLPVVDEHGDLVGFLSDRDVQEFSQPYDSRYGGLEPNDERDATTVNNIMQPGVISVHPDDDVTEVIELMIDHKIGAVPVVDALDGDLVGIVSYVDILREAAEIL